MEAGQKKTVKKSKMIKRRWFFLAIGIAVLIAAGLTVVAVTSGAREQSQRNKISALEQELAAVRRESSDLTNLIRNRLTEENRAKDQLSADVRMANAKLEAAEKERKATIDKLNQELNQARLEASAKILSQSSLYVPSDSSLYGTPVSPSQVEMILWTDADAKNLMRRIYPGNDKYRDTAFDRIMVRPISWYNGILSAVPATILNETWPGSLMGWFSSRYPEIGTGYVWLNKDGSWQVKKIVPAHEGGVVSFYYLINGQWIKVGSNQDSWTPFVRAVVLAR